MNDEFGSTGSLVSEEKKTKSRLEALEELAKVVSRYSEMGHDQNEELYLALKKIPPKVKEEMVEVDFETLKVGEDILVAGERCKLGQHSLSKFVMIMTGPRNGRCLERIPGPKEKVQKLVRKG